MLIRFLTKHSIFDAYNISLNGVIGYTVPIFPTLNLTPVLFVGVATIPLGDMKSTNTELAATLSGGILSPFTENVHIGIFGGIDHVQGEKGDNWEHQDRLWISVSIGNKLF